MKIIAKKVIEPWHIKPSQLKIHKPYHQICQASLKGFFTQTPDRSFPNLVREFYLNPRLVGTSLKTSVRGVEIDLHKDNLGRIFDLPVIGISFTLDGPLGLRNFKHSTSINTLVINPMENKFLSSLAT